MNTIHKLAGLALAAGLGALATAPAAAAENAATVEPGQTFKDCEACPTMVVIPQGEFVMGARPDERWAHQAEEGPRHTVSVPSFALATTEVTFAQWDACVADGGCEDYRPSDNGHGRGDNPVIYVSVNDAQSYMKWLESKAPGVTYRLPSEAEWEYAARAGTKTPFWTGWYITPEQANYNTDYSYNNSPKAPYRRALTPVGSFAANPWGLYDMNGNVWEWASDCWNQNYDGAPEDGSAWKTGDCDEAPLRGGAYNERPQDLRSANRFYLPRAERFFKVGFRLARSLAP